MQKIIMGVLLWLWLGLCVISVQRFLFMIIAFIGFLLFKDDNNFSGLSYSSRSISPV